MVNAAVLRSRVPAGAAEPQVGNEGCAWRLGGWAVEGDSNGGHLELQEQDGPTDWHDRVWFHSFDFSACRATMLHRLRWSWCCASCRQCRCAGAMYANTMPVVPGYLVDGPAYRAAAAGTLATAWLAKQARPTGAQLGCLGSRTQPPLPLRPPSLPQCELHDMAGGHGPDFVLADHLPQAPSQPQAAAQQQDDQAAASGAASGPVPMAD